MLTTALQQSVKIPVKDYLGISEYAYTCYGDSNDKNIYYVVPEIPVFSSQNGKPSFMFYKYRSIDQRGGYAQFTVNLPQPTDEMKDLIRIKLFGSVSTQLSAKSKLIVQYVKAQNALLADPQNKTKQDARNLALQNTGLDETQANKYMSLYDSNKGDDQFLGQLMPDDAKKIDLQQPRYTSIQASLILIGNDAFYSQIPTTLTPSGMGDNNTVFSVSLTGEGATLFEKVLKGTDDGSSVGIRFNFNLDASLPAAKVTVSYSSEKTKSVTQTITRHTWSADEKGIERKYLESGAISIVLDPGLGADEMGMTQDQYNVWKQGLRDWGQKQVEQMLSSQTGLDMSLDLLNDAGGFDKFSESLNETKDFTRIYEENSVVSFSIAPQAQLPSIKSIVGETNLDQYFKEYDLNDPFFQYIQPEFFVTSGLSKYNIQNIVVTAKYDKNNVNTLTFTPDDEKSKKTDKWFIDQNLGRVYSYSYVVNFSGVHAKPYLSGDILVHDSLVETINIAQCGIVYADISTMIDASAWAKFSQVVIKSQYSDIDHNIEVKVDSQIVTALKPPVPFIYPIGIKPENSIYYTADYYTTDGSSFTYIPAGSNNTVDRGVEYGTTRANQIQIENALPKSQSYSIIFLPDDKGGVQLVTFDMVVNYPLHQFKQTKNLVLTAKTDDFSVPIVKNLIFNFLPEANSSDCQIIYSGAIYYTDGRPQGKFDGKVDGYSVVIPL